MTSQSHPSAEKPVDEKSLGKSGRFAAALRILEDAIATRAFPGCAFGVLAGDGIVLQGALGRFTYEENAPAVATETIYDIASLTKVVATTAAAMLLVQRGQLRMARGGQHGVRRPQGLPGRPAEQARRHPRAGRQDDQQAGVSPDVEAAVAFPSARDTVLGADTTAYWL